MSEDNDVGKVSKKLRQQRFAVKEKHFKYNRIKYGTQIWNTGDYQCLALSKEVRYIQNPSEYNRSRRKYPLTIIKLDFFGYDYRYFSSRPEKTLTKVVGSSVNLLPKISPGLRDFLVQKPTNETFVIPGFEGDHHLSFERRSLFGPRELKWRFINDKQAWADAYNLPPGKRKQAINGLKINESRHRLWFADEESDKFIAYLDSVLPEYSTLPAHAFTL